MALLIAGIAFDAYEILLRDKPLAMLAISPKGTVPVLQLPDGQVLEQSRDIVPHPPGSAVSIAFSKAAGNGVCIRHSSPTLKAGQ